MIKIKVIERGEPGVTGGGTKKFYATVTDRTVIDVDRLSKDVSRMSTLSVIDTEAVIKSLIELIPDYLNQGALVQLNQFGSFYISVSSRGETTADEVSSSSVKKSYIRFRPAMRIKRGLGELKYRKVE